MTNEIACKNQQQIPSNYSGVTINITNPTVNAGGCGNPNMPVDYRINNNEISQINPENYPVDNSFEPKINSNNSQVQDKLPQAYPPQYYLNNYNYMSNPQNPVPNNVNPTNVNYNPNTPEQDLSRSQDIINDLNKQSAEEKEAQKNKEEKKIVALTNEYIMSLENYLNNENKEIRLMAAKEILTRLDEDKDRYDDAALNALLNKMLQDPEKLIRVAAMSAFSSGLACGNDYTVELLQNIQQNPNSNKDDAMEAANILLNMSADRETKYVPAKQPAVQQIPQNEQNEKKTKEAEQ